MDMITNTFMFFIKNKNISFENKEFLNYFGNQIRFLRIEEEVKEEEGFEEEVEEEEVEEEEVEEFKSDEVFNSDRIPQVYMCPASIENMRTTIENVAMFNFMDEPGRLWAFNSKRRNCWNKMRLGAICIFGNKKTGWCWKARVLKKIEIQQADDDWPFRTPSGGYWRFAYLLSTPQKINISLTEARLANNAKSNRSNWQTQTLLKEDSARRMLDLTYN